MKTRLNKFILFFVLFFAMISIISATLIQDLTYNYVSSDGHTIYYDKYYNDTEQNPILIMSDQFSPTSTRIQNRPHALKWGNDDFYVINLDTRGKGSSGGTHDINGYECMDMYEAVQDALATDGAYIDESLIYIGGGSGGGGRSQACAAKYPDFYTAGYSLYGMSNYSLWYDQTGRADLLAYMGGVTPAVDLERYEARSSMYSANNFMIPFYFMHNPTDVGVSVVHSRNINETLINLGKADIFYDENNITHGYDPEEYHRVTISNFLKGETTNTIIPAQGDLIINGLIHTKRFKIDLTNKDKVSDLNYNYNNLTFNLNPRSYTGSVNFELYNLNPQQRYEVYVDGVLSSYVVVDNGGKATFTEVI